MTALTVLYMRTVGPLSRRRVLVLVYGGCALASAAFGLAWWAYYGDAVLGGFFLVLAALSVVAYRLLTQPLRRRVEREAERRAMAPGRPTATWVPTDAAAPGAKPSAGGEPPDQAGHISVERPRGYYVAVFRRYKILIDGKKVGAVKRGKTVSFAVIPGPHVVAARIDWSGSPQVTVHVPPGGQITLDVEPAGDAFAGMFSADKMLTLTVRP
jgi:hypothetical protein